MKNIKLLCVLLLIPFTADILTLATQILHEMAQSCWIFFWPL